MELLMLIEPYIEELVPTMTRMAKKYSSWVQGCLKLILLKFLVL
jgi:hypothetical protein